MPGDPDLQDEAGRLAALHRLNVLDSPPEEPFENVVSLVRAVLGVPMAAVSLVDADRQWFKARSGIEPAETTREISFCTHTIQQREPFVVPDAAQDDRFSRNPLVVGEPEVRSYAGIPLRTSDGYNVGSLCALDTEPRDFSASEIAILDKFARIIVDELELRRIASKDQLTGVLTRRGFIEWANQEIERFQRYERSASLAMIDIDHFKQVNDTHGHPAGDVVLQKVARLLRTESRPNDLIGRLGGEEFGMLMPETSADDALRAADRLRERVAQTMIETDAGVRLSVTISVGIAELTRDMHRPEDWIAAADVPLYAAKRGGRNRCVLACEAAAEERGAA